MYRMQAIRSIFGVAVAALFLLPMGASAAAASRPLEISGWIPYWRVATGTEDALQHLDAFAEINPFVYTLKSDGTLKDNGNLSEEPWTSFFVAARQKGVRIVPTIMTSNGDLVHKLLSNSKSRIALEDRIAAMVKDSNFDGIDIDFEGKYAKTKAYFSLFLKGLSMRLGNKYLSCTVEARTPPSDAYKTPPKTLQYANDFAALNAYCNRVKFMTYDQRTADLALNRKNSAVIYAPIADPLWVEKAIRLASKQILKEKIVIGAATYGYEYRIGGEVGNYTYSILWSFNPRYAEQITSLYGVVAARNSAGEMGLAYVPTTTQALIGADIGVAKPVSEDNGFNPVPTNVSATSQNHLQSAFRYLAWSDAQAISDKISLAQKLGVRGVAIFKIDGGEDPRMWDVLGSQK